MAKSKKRKEKISSKKTESKPIFSLSIKQQDYIFIALISFWRGGYIFQFVLPDMPSLNIVVGKVLYTLLVTSLLLFEFNFLKLKKANRYLTQLSVGAILVSLIFAFISTSL